MKLIFGQEATAVATQFHLFPQGARIKFLGMSEEGDEGNIYVFKGIDEPFVFSQELVEGEFILLNK